MSQQNTDDDREAGGAWPSPPYLVTQPEPQIARTVTSDNVDSNGIRQRKDKRGYGYFKTNQGAAQKRKITQRMDEHGLSLVSDGPGAANHVAEINESIRPNSGTTEPQGIMDTYTSRTHQAGSILQYEGVPYMCSSSGTGMSRYRCLQYLPSGTSATSYDAKWSSRSVAKARNPEGEPCRCRGFLVVNQTTNERTITVAHDCTLISPGAVISVLTDEASPDLSQEEEIYDIDPEGVLVTSTDESEETEQLIGTNHCVQSDLAMRRSSNEDNDIIQEECRSHIGNDGHKDITEENTEISKWLTRYEAMETYPGKPNRESDGRSLTAIQDCEQALHQRTSTSTTPSSSDNFDSCNQMLQAPAPEKNPRGDDEREISDFESSFFSKSTEDNWRADRMIGRNDGILDLDLDLERTNGPASQLRAEYSRLPLGFTTMNPQDNYSRQYEGGEWGIPIPLLPYYSPLTPQHQYNHYRQCDACWWHHNYSPTIPHDQFYSPTIPHGQYYSPTIPHDHYSYYLQHDGGERCLSCWWPRDYYTMTSHDNCGTAAREKTITVPHELETAAECSYFRYQGIPYKRSSTNRYRCRRYLPGGTAVTEKDAEWTKYTTAKSRTPIGMGLPYHCPGVLMKNQETNEYNVTVEHECTLQSVAELVKGRLIGDASSALAQAVGELHNDGHDRVIKSTKEMGATGQSLESDDCTRMKQKESDFPSMLDRHLDGVKVPRPFGLYSRKHPPRIPRKNSYQEHVLKSSLCSNRRSMTLDLKSTFGSKRTEDPKNDSQTDDLTCNNNAFDSMSGTGEFDTDSNSAFDASAVGNDASPGLYSAAYLQDLIDQLTNALNSRKETIRCLKTENMKLKKQYAQVCDKVRLLEQKCTNDPHDFSDSTKRQKRDVDLLDQIEMHQIAKNVDEQPNGIFA